MDINLLSRMVGELVLDNDRVSLPGVGSFLVEDVPATFSDRGYTINPPYRRLSFSQAKGDDTLLVDLYAVSNRVNSREAEKIISRFLTELLSDLRTKGTVVFPGLGRMKMTRQNDILFFCDEDLDIFPGGFGLEPISLKTRSEAPVAEPAAEPALEPAAEPEAAATEPKKKSVFWRVVLILFLLAVVTAAVFMALTKLAPDFLDTLLYTPEELYIINY